LSFRLARLLGYTIIVVDIAYNKLINILLYITVYLQIIIGFVFKKEGLEMIDAIAVSDFVNASISISRFNRGQAGKVFEEVNADGIKIVFKNNRPECILLSPQLFEEIKNVLEDYRLLIEAQERLKDTCESNYISEEEVMKELGITEADLNTTSS